MSKSVRNNRHFRFKVYLFTSLVLLQYQNRGSKSLETIIDSILNAGTTKPSNFGLEASSARQKKAALIADDITQNNNSVKLSNSTSRSSSPLLCYPTRGDARNSLLQNDTKHVGTLITTMSGLSKVSKYGDIPRYRKPLFYNNEKLCQDYKDTLEIVGVSYDDYQSIIVFEQNKELCNFVQSHLDKDDLVQLLNLFNFFNANPIFVNEYPALKRLDSELNQVEDFVGSNIDRNHKLLHRLSEFLMTFLNKQRIELEFDGYKQKILKNITEIKHIDEVFFDIILSILKYRSQADSNIWLKKCNEESKQNAIQIKLNLTFRIYEAFINYVKVAFDTKSFSVFALQLCTVQCTRIEDMLQLLIREKFSKSKVPMTKNHKLGFYKVYKANGKTFSKSSRKSKRLLQSFLRTEYYSNRCQVSKKVPTNCLRFAVYLQIKFVRHLHLLLSKTFEKNCAKSYLKHLKEKRLAVLADMLILNENMLLVMFNSIKWINEQ